MNQSFGGSRVAKLGHEFKKISTQSFFTHIGFIRCVNTCSGSEWLGISLHELYVLDPTVSCLIHYPFYRLAALAWKPCADSNSVGTPKHQVIGKQ